MNNKPLQVNISSIETNYQKITNTFNDLLTMVKKYKEMIQDTSDICDTQTADLYRQFAQNYIDFQVTIIEKEFRNTIDKLVDIANIYKESYAIIVKSVNGE